MKTVRAIIKIFFLVFAASILMVLPPADAGADDTLATVRQRGKLRCGISDDLQGFGIQDASGRWCGMDADFSRAVAAAALGDPEKVTFVPLIPSARFPALKAGDVDLLLRATTWTLSREAGLDVIFPGTLYYDFQSFMVRRDSAMKTLTDLNGATIGVVKGTTHEEVLRQICATRGIQFQPVVMESFRDAAKAFFDGKFKVLTADGSTLAIIRMHAPGGPEASIILPDLVHKEPLGPCVRNGDEQWFTLVRWVLFALIEAEERGITRENVIALRDTSKDPSVQEFLGKTGDLGPLLGVDRDWVVRIVQAVGNYGEMFDRNLGSASPLKLDRGYNRLWKNGGLMIAPPFR
jgi:general L-amino acid transport system substrate-binding protein